MKRAGTIILGYVVMLLTALLPAQQTAAPAAAFSMGGNRPAASSQGSSANGEVRALWVVRYTLSSPEAVRQLVERAKENGFTDLIVQVRGRGDAWYRSPFEPRAEELATQPAGYDPLAHAIEEAHRVGIRVHAWLNIYLVANIDALPKSPEHLIYRHPEWLMIPRGLAADLYQMDPQTPGYFERIVEFTRENRAELEGLFVSPANREVRDRIFNLWLDVAQRYDVDGLHFDYVRYPNRQYDYSRASLDQFRVEMEKNLPEEDRDFLLTRIDNDPLIYAATFPEKYADFQRRQVSLLVERIYSHLKKVKPGLKISAAVFANDEDAARSRFQDWKHWLKNGWLDAVCPMAYTPDTEVFRRQIRTAISHAAGREVWGGIGAYRQPVEGAREKISAARDLGAQGFILFSYDSSIKVSDMNPQGDYLERLRDLIKTTARNAVQ